MKKQINQIKKIVYKYMNIYFHLSYSQEGEDMILRRIFGKQQTGFYIDVGAHHPKRFSNTYFFYKKGWKGINIDAMPGSMKIFKKIRKRDINVEKPIAGKKQTLTYYAFNDPALNGFSKQLSNSRIGKKYFIKYTKKMRTFTLEDILDRHLPANQKIDFLSIDVEGLDFDVLKSNNFTKHSPKIIIIEMLFNNLEEIINNNIYKFLNSKNYSFYAKTVNSVFFIHNEFNN